MEASTASRPSFTYRTERSHELRLAVKALWADAQIRRRVFTELYLQIPIAFGLMCGCYLLLILAHPGGWASLLLAGTALGAIIMGGLFHDSNHGAVFTPLGLNRRVDYIFAWLVSDVMLGMSSYHWRKKHDWHHTETNILDYDGDLQTEPVLRLHPGRPYLRTARYQHIYAWPLYLLMLIPLHIRGHKIALFGGKHGVHQIPRVRGWELTGTLIGLAVFYTWALVLPIWQFGLLGLWGIMAVVGVVGFVYAAAFQFAHAVDTVEFPAITDLEQPGERKEGYVHQLKTTANFCPHNRPLGWTLGGLTLQVWHHFFRQYPHTFYRRVTPIAEDWCRRHGLPYHVQPNLWSAFRSHFNHLREMGRQGRFVEIEMG